MEIGDFGEFWSLEEKLLFGNQPGDESHFGIVQMKLAAVHLLVHVGISEEDLGRAGFDDDVEEFRTLELVERLRGKNHGGIVLAPGLEGIDDVALNAGVAEKHPNFIDKKGLEDGRDIAIRDDFIRAIENVKKKRFEEFRVAAHLLEVEALKARKGDGVLGVVEEKTELTTAHPFGKGARELARKRVRQHVEGSQRRVERIQIFNLFVQLAVCSWIKRAERTPEQNLHEQGQEIEICLGRRQAERVNGELARFESDPKIRAAEKPRKAFKTSAKIEDEGVRVVFLEVRDQKIQKERLPAAGAAENHGMRRVAVMEVQKVGRAVIGFKRGEIFPAEVVIPRFSGMERKEKRQIGVVRI